MPEACKGIIRVKDKSKPAKKAMELYDREYRDYAALYPALKDWFAQSAAG